MTAKSPQRPSTEEITKAIEKQKAETEVLQAQSEEYTAAEEAKKQAIDALQKQVETAKLKSYSSQVHPLAGALADDTELDPSRFTELNAKIAKALGLSPEALDSISKTYSDAYREPRQDTAELIKARNDLRDARRRHIQATSRLQNRQHFAEAMIQTFQDAGADANALYATAIQLLAEVSAKVAKNAKEVEPKFWAVQFFQAQAHEAWLRREPSLLAWIEEHLEKPADSIWPVPATGKFELDGFDLAHPVGTEQRMVQLTRLMQERFAEAVEAEADARKGLADAQRELEMLLIEERSKRPIWGKAIDALFHNGAPDPQHEHDNAAAPKKKPKAGSPSDQTTADDS